MKALLTFESSVMASDLRTCDAMTGNFATPREILTSVKAMLSHSTVCENSRNGEIECHGVICSICNDAMTVNFAFCKRSAHAKAHANVL